MLAVEELEDLQALEYLAQRACEVTDGADCADCTKSDPNAPSNCDWDWHISSREAGRNNVCEYIGFVYNKARGAEFLGPYGYYNEGQNDTIKREPYGARFRLGQFDFTMVAIHQRHGGHISKRQAEAVYSGDIFTQFQDRNCGSERDVFYGGDMNLNAHDSHWSLLYGSEYQHLHATWAVDPEQGTTLARTGDRTITDNSFDQVFWSTASTTRFEVDESGAFDFTSPEIAAIHGGDTMGSNVYVTVSDHIPAYVILSDDIWTRDDDDNDVSNCAFTPWPSEASNDTAALRNREDCPVV